MIDLKKIMLNLWLLAVVAISLPSNAEFIVSHRSPETEGDTREDYNNALLSLALEKTKTKYGDYTLQAIPTMSIPRLLSTTTLKTYPNLIFELTYEEKFTTTGELTYINFPIDLGIVGYRVCFINAKIKEALTQVTSLAELQKYSIGQGIGWSDVAILRANGFHVNEINNYGNIFKMVSAGRIDLFLRGANELKSEFETFGQKMHLVYDESFMFLYPLPRFFYIASENKLAKKRIEEGLIIAYHDGSMKKLWQEKYGESIKFSKLKQRKIFRLNNPSIKNLPTDYEQYLYNPLTE
jgi:hypothetical protein